MSTIIVHTSTGRGPSVNEQIRDRIIEVDSKELSRTELAERVGSWAYKQGCDDTKFENFVTGFVMPFILAAIGFMGWIFYDYYSKR